MLYTPAAWAGHFRISNSVFGVESRLPRRCTMLFRLSLLLLGLAFSSFAQTVAGTAPNIFDSTLSESGAKTPELSTNDLKKIIANHSATVLDTRPQKEFAISHIPGAVNVAA